MMKTRHFRILRLLTLAAMLACLSTSAWSAENEPQAADNQKVQTKPKRDQKADNKDKSSDTKIIANTAQLAPENAPTPNIDDDQNDQDESKTERWKREREARQQPFLVRYTGELMRADSTPISGVLPMTFSLYTNENDDKAIWKERHYVAVDLGTYTIDLGQQVQLSRSLENQTRWLAIEIDSFGEVLREKMVLRPWTNPKPQTPTHVQNLSFAEIADRALTADHAHMAADAERLGGKTLKEIDKYGELYRDFVQLRAKLNAIQASGGTRVAERTTITEEAGKRGGQYFRVTCPEGQVVVGITGSADDSIHELKLICAPLENRR